MEENDFRIGRACFPIRFCACCIVIPSAGFVFAACRALGSILKIVTLIYAATLNCVGSKHLTRYSLICAQVELNLLSLPLKQGIIFFAAMMKTGITSSDPMQEATHLSTS